MLRKESGLFRVWVAELEAYNARLEYLVHVHEKSKDVSSLEYDIVQLKRENEPNNEISSAG